MIYVSTGLMKGKSIEKSIEHLSSNGIKNRTFRREYDQIFSKN